MYLRPEAGTMLRRTVLTLGEPRLVYVPAWRKGRDLVNEELGLTHAAAPEPC
jgi:hypothetical protein